MLSVREYRDRLIALVEPLAPVQMRLEQAYGLALAEDLRALVAVPAFDNSAMDGFAVQAASLPQLPASVPVVGDCPAGATHPVSCGAGVAVRVMTGAPIPLGADTVIPVEDTNLAAGSMELPEQVELRKIGKVGAHLRREGENLRVGDPVLSAGTRLGGPALAAAGAAGHDRVLVRPRPRVAVITTGDELVAPGKPLGFGQIYDSNSLLLGAAVRDAGAELAAVLHASDSVQDFAEVLARAVAEADLVFTTGGVSAGAFDVVKEALTNSGEGEFCKVRMQPGKPQGYAIVQTSRPDSRRVPVLTLPGNPVSVFISFVLFGLPVLHRLVAATTDSLSFWAVAKDEWNPPSGRAQFVPVHVDYASPNQPQLRRVHPLGSGSHLVASLHLANAVAAVPAEVTRVNAGDQLRVFALPRNGWLEMGDNFYGA